MDIRAVIVDHSEKYPLMQPTDAVKLIYQAIFGGGHMIKNEASALEYIKQEYASREHVSEPIRCESLGDTARVYLDGKLAGSELELICKMFCESAKLYSSGFEKSAQEVKNKFFLCLEELRSLCKEGRFAFSIEELDTYLSRYRDAGYPPVSHSDIYRQVYRPSYRVIDSKYARLLPCIMRIASHLRNSGRQTVIAVDGRCAAGKSTAAELIAKLFDAQIIHIDDFFLPPELRTEERLAEIGGNIHYERFSDEVLPNLRSDCQFTHRVFDCKSFSYSTEPHTVKPSRVVIVEGVYALHPKFGKYYDISVFLNVTPEQQLARLASRCSEAMLARFQKEWIPMEERYFEAFDIQKKCDSII